MTIALTEEHHALADSVRRFAERHISRQLIRARLEAREPGRPDYWDILATQGLLGLHVAEDYGGQGFGLVELAVALEELGRALEPGPYLPTVLASAVIQAGEAAVAQHELLAGLVDGRTTGAVALQPGISCYRVRDRLVITGDCEPVLGAAAADLIVVPVSTDDGEVWAIIDAADATVIPLDSLDLTRGVAKVSVRKVSVPEDRILNGLPGQRVRGMAAVLYGAEACGIASWCVRVTAEYAKMRQQFGRPIGQFQAVKHRCARMLAAVEQARAAVWDAARALDGEGPDDSAYLAAAVAAVLAPDAAVRCAADCIQVHGGIGYTWEHDAHLYYRRALTLRALLGRGGQWAETAGRLAANDVQRHMTLDLPPEAEPVRQRIRVQVAELATLDSEERRGRMAAEGWVTPHLPRPWGRDATPLEQLLIDEELRAAGVKPPNLLIGAWVVPSLVSYGSPRQRDRFLPGTLRGEIVWCQLFSEPGAGSDLASLQTRAERVAGGWRLTGQKIWTSLAQWAHWGICLARTDPTAPKHEGITYFLVEMGSPGMDIRPLREMTGDAVFNEIFLDGVFVPDECVVGEVDAGWRVARETLTNERVGLARGWGSGPSVADLLELVRGLRELQPGDDERLGRQVCEGQSLAALGLSVTLRQLSGTDPGPAGSVRKLLGMEHCQHVAELGWSLLGAMGAVSGHRGAGPASHWAHMVLATRAYTIAGGTTEIQLNIIAERLLGLPRDP